MGTCQSCSFQTPSDFGSPDLHPILAEQSVVATGLFSCCRVVSASQYLVAALLFAPSYYPRIASVDPATTLYLLLRTQLLSPPNCVSLSNLTHHVCVDDKCPEKVLQNSNLEDPDSSSVWETETSAHRRSSRTPIRSRSHRADRNA